MKPEVDWGGGRGGQFLACQNLYLPRRSDRSGAASRNTQFPARFLQGRGKGAGKQTDKKTSSQEDSSLGR
jgi:hypothetical protein